MKRRSGKRAASHFHGASRLRHQVLETAACQGFDLPFAPPKFTRAATRDERTKPMGHNRTPSPTQADTRRRFVVVLEGTAGDTAAGAAQLTSTIKAHIAKGDKAADKAEQHYIAAGQHLKQLKAEHDGHD